MMAQIKENAKKMLLRRSRHQPNDSELNDSKSHDSKSHAHERAGHHKPRRRLPKGLLYALASLGVVSLVALAFRPAPIVVDVGEVTQGPLQVTIDAEGKTQVIDRYVVAAPVSGRLQRIELDAGDTVSAGSVIARLDPLPLNTQVQTAQARLQQLQAELRGVETQRPKSEAIAQAQAEVSAAEAQQQAALAEVSEARSSLAQAERDRRRAQSLEADGAISRQERESAQLAETREAQSLARAQRQLESAIANVAAAQEALALLKAEQRDPDYLVSAYEAEITGVQSELDNLVDEANRTTIAAPISGAVLRVLESSERFVSAGEPLLELGELGGTGSGRRAAPLELVIDVLSADAVKINPGDTIWVEQWGGAETLTAIVSKIEPAAFTEVSALGVEEQRVNIIGLFEGEAAKLSAMSLGDGYRIEARIVVWEADETLRVPVSALYRCDAAWCVFRVENGRTYPREVVIGQRNPNFAAVDSGLGLGDMVVLHPSEQMGAGRKVESR